MGEQDLVTIASTQEGLVTRDQVRSHLTRSQLESRLSTGRLEMVRWGVYRFCGVPPTRWQELRAACLAAGPNAVASHRSAAELWSMPGVTADGPEVTVPRPLWVRLPGVRCHQSSRLVASQQSIRHGVPATTATRTLADLSTAFGAQFLGQLVDDALRRRVSTKAELSEVYELLAGRGRRRLTLLRAVLETRLDDFDPGGSAREVDLLRTLVGAGLPRPVQQHQVVVESRVYVLDFAYPELRIGMEYDGRAAHTGRGALERGATRHNALALAGWTVLHFTSAHSPSQIVADVTAARDRALRAFTGSQV